jgi:hypothetical protein
MKKTATAISQLQSKPFVTKYDIPTSSTFRLVLITKHDSSHIFYMVHNSARYKSVVLYLLSKLIMRKTHTIADAF